jgi:hypothetical protein
MIAPKHKHDCDTCIFLGLSQDGQFDLYYHPGKPPYETLIARYGSNGDYKSGMFMVGLDPHITEAHQLAVQQNLIG